MKAGTNVYNWDGVNSSSIQSTTGTYMVRIDAEDAQGNKLKVDPVSQETIIGVTFEGGDTNFLVGDAKNPQKVGFKNVAKIEGDATTRNLATQARADRTAEARMKSEQAANPNAAQDAKASEDSPVGKDLPQALQEKIKAEQELRAKAGAETGNEVASNKDTKETPVKAEGFPNGLSD
jgi:hypothetical protein